MNSKKINLSTRSQTQSSNSTIQSVRSQSVLSQIRLIALPIIIQGIVFQLQSLTDKAFLGNLDVKYISALGAAQFPYCPTLDLVVALQTGLIIIVARLWGAGNKEQVQKYTLSSMLYSNLLSIGIFFIWFFATNPLLKVMQVDPIILSDSATYIRICSGTLLLLGIDASIQAMLQGIGNTRPIMVASMIKVFFNIIISYVLIFGKLGFSPMNIEGAAIGTLLANLISSIGLIIYCAYKWKDIFDSKELEIKLAYFKEIVKIGLPTAIENYTWNASNLVLIALLNSLSYKSMAVYTLTFGMEIILYAIFTGIGRAVMTLIGQAIGAGNRELIHRYYRYGIMINLITVMVCAVIFLLGGRQILGFFSQDREIIETALPYLLLTAVLLIPKSLNISVGSGIRAHGHTGFMLFSQIIGSILVISCSFFFIKYLGVGIIGIYLTIFIDESIRATINAVYYHITFARSARMAIA